MTAPHCLFRQRDKWVAPWFERKVQPFLVITNASRSKVKRGAVRLGQGDEIGQVVALALAVDEPGADRDTPNAGGLEHRRLRFDAPRAGISTSGGAKTEAGSGTGWSSSKIVGLASPLVETPKMAEPLVKMSGFPKSPRALVITARPTRELDQPAAKRDEILQARHNLSRFYAISQIEYCRNFVFKRNFPIHKLFERSCELGLWRLTADKIASIFGTRLNRRMRGKLATVIDQIEHGHHVFRAHFKHAFLKQYEKFSTFLRNELCSNNLTDFGLRKGLDHLDEVRRTFQTITSRFAGYQAQWLNVHVDFPLLQRIALPITVGSVRYPGTKIHDVRVIRLFEVLLHGGPHVGGWTAKQIHRAVLTTFHLSERAYGLNQLRYDLRKLKGHGLIERDGSRYAYRLTTKGVQVALLFLFFHKRLCGPIANSCFHHRPDPHYRPNSQLKAAYHSADKAIQKIVDVLAAA